MPDFNLRKYVRVMPPGTVDPAGRWRKVNIRGIAWPHTRSWRLATEAEYAADVHRQVETVIDSGGWLPGLAEAHIDGYVPGGWTLPVAIVLDFKMAKYSVNGIPHTLDKLFDPQSKWGKVDPASLVPGVGLYSPGGQCNFAFTPTLAHILVYLGMNAKINYTCTGLGDLNICFADDGFTTFAVADGSDMKTSSCRSTSPQGLVKVHGAAPISGAHRFDVTMTTTVIRVRNDMAPWTETTHPPASPEAMALVGRVAGPLTVTRMTFDSAPAGPATLPTLPINLPDEVTAERSDAEGETEP